MCQRSQAALQKAADLAEAKVEELIERWNSDLGATVETRAAGAAAYIIAGLQGDIIALQIQCDRAATPAPQSHLRGLERPISHPLRRETDETWRQVIDLFRKHGLSEPPVRLRDELVIALEWAWFGEAAATEGQADA